MNNNASGKTYIMLDATYASFQPTLHIAQKLMRCEPLTHHIHIRSIYNNLNSEEGISCVNPSAIVQSNQIV